jgi:hypothetical protein
MTSGLLTLLDSYTPSAPGQLWVVEIGQQPGNPTGQRDAFKSTPAITKPGEAYKKRSADR